VITTDDIRQVPKAPMHDLTQLARPFPPGFIERKDGTDYVAHHVVTQRLLSVVGPFDFELVEIIRGDVAEVAPIPNGKSRRARSGTPALHNIAVGGVWRLTCEVDGRRVRIEEVGDVGDVHNWPHDGARLKDAASDALKRCAMRLGLGLHLWAQEHYFLDRQLWTILEQPGSPGEAEEAVARQPGRAGAGLDGFEPPAAEPDAEAGAAAAPDAPDAAGPAEEHAADPADGQLDLAADQRVADRGRQRRGATTGEGGPARSGRGRRRSVPVDDRSQPARRMPVRGTAEWEQPDKGLAERFEALVEAAGVSIADAREFLHRSPHYSGVSDPQDMHGPTLARLVERMGQKGADGTSGLAAFRAKVEEVLDGKSA
jgi:hypothetical protein